MIKQLTEPKTAKPSDQQMSDITYLQGSIKGLSWVFEKVEKIKEKENRKEDTNE